MPNDAQMPELLPCPFCGGAARAFETQNDSEFQAQVQCSGCGAEFVFWLPWTAGYGDRSKAMGDLMLRWNTRADLCDSGQQVRALEVDDLAQIIRVVDGNNTLGAGELAEAILEAMPAPRIVGALTPAPQSEGQDALKISPEYQALFDEVKQRAQPEVQVRAENVLDAANNYLTNQYGLSVLGHPVDRQRILAALTPAPQPAGEAVLVSQDALIDLIGEFGREVCYMLDDCETSGPVGEEVHTITDESLTKVSAILDLIDALPFEEPGVILGTGAMLQAAIKQTFQTHPPQPSETVAELLEEARSGLCAYTGGPDGACSETVKRIDAALRALKGGE